MDPPFGSKLRLLASHFVRIFHACPEGTSRHEELQDCCSSTFVKLDWDFALTGIATLGLRGRI